MAAKASEVKVATTGKNLGEFIVGRYNMFDDEDMVKYAELRTNANDASQGIYIEQIREYTRKTTVRDGGGEDAMVTTTEEVFLVVHYWIKKPKLEKGDRDDDVKEARRDWVKERSVG